MPQKNCEIIWKNCEIRCGLRTAQFSSCSSGKLNTQTCELLRLDHHAWKRSRGNKDSLIKCCFHVWLETLRRTLLCCIWPLRVTWTSRKKYYIYFFKFWTKYNTMWKEIVFKWITQFILHISLFVYFTTSSYFIYLLLFNAVIRSITMFQPIFHFEIVNIYKHNFIKELSCLPYL